MIRPFIEHTSDTFRIATSGEAVVSRSAIHLQYRPAGCAVTCACANLCAMSELHFVGNTPMAMETQVRDTVRAMRLGIFKLASVLALLRPSDSWHFSSEG